GAGDDGVDLAAVGLAVDLLAGEFLVGLDVPLAVVLVEVERAGGLVGDAFGDVDVVVGRVAGDVGGGDDDLGAEGAEAVDLLLAHLVGHGEDGLVALGCGGHGGAHAGVAAGVLDDGAAGLEQAVLLGLVDDVPRHAVLDG